MNGLKRIAFSAHDALKPALSAWAFANETALRPHSLTATGNTARAIMDTTRLTVDSLKAGVLGGDLELGALIAEGRVDVAFLFADPLTRQPHDVDHGPILRVAAISQTVVALNEATADFLLRSALFDGPYHRPHGGRPLPSVPTQLGDHRTTS